MSAQKSNKITASVVPAAVASALMTTALLGPALVVATNLAMAGSAWAADTGLAPVDRDFINKTAQGNQMELAAGKLAAQRALDPSVKKFGERMVSDHSANYDALKSLADSKQMPLSTDVSPEGQAALGKLEGLNGTEFDKAYAKMMVQDHTTVIGEFEKEAKKGMDADVKAYVEQTLPTLRHHLMLANQLSAAAKKSP